MKSSTTGLGLSFGRTPPSPQEKLKKKKTRSVDNTYRVRMSGEENTENVDGVGIYSMNHGRKSQKFLR